MDHIHLTTNIIYYLIIIVGTPLGYYWWFRTQTKFKPQISYLRKIIDKPSFSVLKIGWKNFCIIYEVIFDTNRILFIRPDKVPRDTTSIDEIFEIDEKNIEIPFNEIKKIKFGKSTNVLSAIRARAGKLTIESEKYRGTFDILVSETLDNCINLAKKNLRDKVVVKRF